MHKKDNIKLDALSNIDDEIIDKASEIRSSWLSNLGRNVKRSRVWLRVVAIAACICLVFGGGLFGVLQFLGKQVPIYTGMTVQNNAPVVNQTAKADGAYQIDLLSDTAYDREIDQNDPYKKGENGKKLDDSIDERFKNSIESAKDEYFAKKNEDVYFVIHIENPDNFVILSFTLNGTVYSSYMFEEGSDMETLILKYNVGDVEGEQSYTIDAIKYVDGKKIKDVIMGGERTVTVNIYPEEQPTFAVTKETINFLGVSFVADINDPKNLIAASEGKLYAMLYDGESLIQEKEIAAGDTVTFEGLAPDTLYQYALIAFYDSIDGEGKKAHVLYEKAFYTEKIVSLETSELEGVDIRFAAKWNEDYTGTKQFDTLALYEGETKIRDLDVNSTVVNNLPFEKELSLVASYTANGQKYTLRCSIESPQSSKGLAMSAGIVKGLGDCEDTELYINAPIGEKAFYGNSYVKKIYLGEGVSEIGASAFSGCTGLTNVTFCDTVTSIGASAFLGCENITGVNISDISKWYKITFANTASTPLYDAKNKNLYLNGTLVTDIIIPDSVNSIGAFAFRACESLTSVTISKNVTNIGDHAFTGCINLAKLTVADGNTKYHSANNCLIETNSRTLVVGCKNSIIPDDGSVTIIGVSAFSCCTTLTNITIPNSVTKIQAAAFFKCTGLTSVTIGNGVTGIGGSTMFSTCTSLTSVTFENTTGWMRNGVSVDVTNSTTNATNLKNGYSYTRS